MKRPENELHKWDMGVVEAQPAFDEHKILHDLAHFLPTQTPLKDFIHHNSLHAFQHQKFYDAIFQAAKIFGFHVTLELKEFRELFANGRIRKDILEKQLAEKKGNEASAWMDKLLNKNYDSNNDARIGRLRAQWKSRIRFDLDNEVQPLLFRVLSSYLDQGISIWQFPVAEGGFLASLRELEANSFSSFFRSKRARRMLLAGETDLRHLLGIVVGDERYFTQYLMDQQFSHRGWSGMVCALEASPHSLLDPRKISLKDLLVFELLLEIDALDARTSGKWEPLCHSMDLPPEDIFEPVRKSELHEVLSIWQDAFEWSYYDDVLAGIKTAGFGKASLNEKTPASFQALFCIDEREDSLRRHIERTDPACETLGTPGFFGVEFYFQSQFGKFYDKLCPAPVTPKYLIKETDVTQHRAHELLYHKGLNGFVKGLFATITLGFLAGFKIIKDLFSPKMSPAISDAFEHMNRNSKLVIENKNGETENGLQVGFNVDEMTVRVEGLLRGVGLIRDFAPLIYAIAHGSSSANNPHHGAHDCGACSGRPGSVNSRVFAFMANHSVVRENLRKNGIDIPAATQFVGGLHDTASDMIQFYDEDVLTPVNKERHKINLASFDTALDFNAKERSRRFASITTRQDIKKVRREILNRSVSMFEPRPELGHGTNTLCIIGRRALTKSLFLDRRAFMNSYDHTTDPEGKLLTGLMRPIGLVCGGINLEYYFSRVDNYKLGAGTKLPHNVVGLIGVANSSDGDLRPGLPLQMIEVHDPVRLLVVVEHRPEIVLKCIQDSPAVYEWYKNEWVHIVALDPDTNTFHYFKDGGFTQYDPIRESIPEMDIDRLIEESKEMETNYIADATKENLPVYVIK